MPAGNYTLSGHCYGVIVAASGCQSDTIANITDITISYPKRQGISVQPCTNKTIKNCMATNNKGVEFLRNHNKVTQVPVR